MRFKETRIAGLIETLMWLLGVALALRMAFFAFLDGAWISGVIGLFFASILYLFFRAAWRRARRPIVPLGSGIVEIKERQVTVFGPLFGGRLDVDDLVRVEVECFKDDRPNEWVLTSENGKEHRFEGGALGADGIYDALEVLPGMRVDAAAEAMMSNRDRIHLIWQRVGG